MPKPIQTHFCTCLWLDFVKVVGKNLILAYPFWIYNCAFIFSFVFIKYVEICLDNGLTKPLTIPNSATKTVRLFETLQMSVILLINFTVCASIFGLFASSCANNWRGLWNHPIQPFSDGHFNKTIFVGFRFWSVHSLRIHFL